MGKDEGRKEGREPEKTVLNGVKEGGRETGKSGEKNRTVCIMKTVQHRGAQRQKGSTMLHHMYNWTWNLSSTKQGTLKTVKQEGEHLNIVVLGVRKLKWTGMGHSQSGNYKAFYSGNEKLRRNREWL